MTESVRPIDVLQLRKSYGVVEVLHGVSFQIDPGQLVGFLGSNGAGKTTTIRILLGLIRSSAGTACLFGERCQPHTAAFRRNVGYLPGEVSFYPWLSGLTTLKYFAEARGVNCGDEIQRLSELFQLDLAKTVRKYSAGMKQKLGLIQALMHRPKLLILDEPTNGLDPLVRQSLMVELRRSVALGSTVLFSSHTLSEVDELCDRVIILRNGAIIENSPIDMLRKRAIRHVEVSLARASETVKKMPAEAHLLRQSDSQLLFNWSGSIETLLEWLREVRCDDVTIGKPSLDDLFMTYYRKESAGP